MADRSLASFTPSLACPARSSVFFFCCWWRPCVFWFTVEDVAMHRVACRGSRELREGVSSVGGEVVGVQVVIARAGRGQAVVSVQKALDLVHGRQAVGGFVGFCL